MEARDPETNVGLDSLITQIVPFFEQLVPADQERLRQITLDLQQRGMPEPFVHASLRSTAEVLREMHDEDNRGDNVFRRENVRRFMQENAITDSVSRPVNFRRERKREERERMQANVHTLLREARLAHARHEVKKTRNMLLKIDQRELRRMLGKEGDDLCRQINTWLRSTAPMF